MEVKNVKSFVSYWYQRYLLATELYMVEPWERAVMHIVTAILFILFWFFNSYTVGAMERYLGSTYTDSASFIN